MTVSYRQNKSPFAVALGDWFLLRTYVLTRKASPNDWEIVIVIIIVVGEAQLVWHIGGIIAQTVYLDIVFLVRTKVVKQMQCCRLMIPNTNGGYWC
jgi:hypothetical protein